ncbi:MAG TPA: isoaspartyl peptidase/L-asparaginase family protein [Candidatus Acidoferrales bacterium]|nr:isoaspartyl peptidase/L-asparaginase family protein [Candidatus Acidoferrales bacterium]
MAVQPTIIVHGGAGHIAKEKIPQMLDGCREAAALGWNLLAKGKSALDAVERAVTALEDNPLFNAGTGSTLNELGAIEMDAAIMDGSSLSVGAVAAVQGIKNPIQLARKVLEDGRHVLLAGEGALLFARRIGFPECAPESLIVAKQQRRWEKKHGTVGCVARDRAGRLAAGTSTGGIFDKMPGRVGDSPLPGCGTYADEVGAVSCTGNGEAIIRVLLAKTVLEFVRAGLHPSDAAKRAIELLAQKTSSRAGLILVDREGRAGHARNTECMPICIRTADDTILSST